MLGVSSPKEYAWWALLPLPQILRPKKSETVGGRDDTEKSETKVANSSSEITQKVYFQGSDSAAYESKTKCNQANAFQPHLLPFHNKYHSSIEIAAIETD
ncbi:hypothetical protein Tco_1415079, partial [Tanacetum coccineum]